MNSWNKIPLFRLLLPFLMGIMIAFNLQLSTSYLYVIIVTAVFGIMSISYFNRYFSSFSNRWIFGVLINLLFLVFGVQLILWMEIKIILLLMKIWIRIKVKCVFTFSILDERGGSWNLLWLLVYLMRVIISEKIITYSFLIRRCCCGIRIL